MGTRRGRGQARLCRGRRLVLVDIENIAGRACRTAESVLSAKAAVENTAHIHGGDHVVIATSHIGLLHVGSNWVGVRYVVRSGANGADLALLDVLTENIPARYEQVVLASGDGIFAPAVAELASAGVETTVLGRRGSVARSLQMAASHVLYVPRDHGPADPRAIA